MENDYFEIDGIEYNRYRGSNMYHTYRPMFQMIEDHETEDVLWGGDLWCTYCNGSGPSTKGSAWKHIIERKFEDDNRRASGSVFSGPVYATELGEWSPR
jgi:hypothetical protein